MTAETASFAEGAIEVTLLQQQGRDPFTPTPERTAQIADVASRIANFIGEAKSTIDIAIYDFRLRDEAAAIVGDGLRAQARKGVQVRIAYDHSADPGPDAIPSAAPSHLESDQKPLGTDSFVRSLADIAQVKGVTGYRVLMHNKYIVRDAASADAAVFTGSSNYTNDSWGLQDNNLLCLRSQQLASYYARDFADLWSRGKIVDSTGSHDIGTVRLGDVAVTIAFTPGESAAVLKEIVGAIAAARNRLYVASVVLSSGPILAALSEAIDRGLPLGGLYDGPQMDQVERQWKAANVGADKVNTWQKVARHLARKNSIPFDRQNQSQPHNFMHNKLVVADQVVVTGSFNLSNHAMGNAENVLLIRDAQ
ncbi:MAG TPA: phosphatidylserine/phosphatidylglycerophosphate/cardiolipin synthase family protein, partial [Xanthobacteraceae bacterium]|nr:phosphatidylserine/phosphatidylglycerophosphate/cardiolipin synthase family protein [Xanthobacteraceae bacterium]